FCRAVAGGLELMTVGPEIYRGISASRPTAPSIIEHDARLNLVAHVLKSGIDGGERIVHLPKQAQIQAVRDAALEPGGVWARVLHHASGCWGQLRLPGNRLADACGGGTALVAHLQQVWFESQLVRIATALDQVLLPAELATNVAYRVRPQSLWWQ